MAIQMNAETILSDALKHATPTAQVEFLDNACGDDAKLRAEVDSLLSAHANAGSFLAQPPLSAEALTESEQPETRLYPKSSPLETNDTSESPLEGNTDETNYDNRWQSFLKPCDTPNRIGRLGQYEVVELIGRGGMGVVLLAHDPKLNRVVAIKLLAPELSADPMAVRRFLREARAAAAVSHDHVVTIFAIHEEDRPPLLVMEFIEGQSLQQKIDKQGALDVKSILRIGMQVSAGLAAAHRQGLMHRDIKPANILLENGIERVKLTDFGLARAVDDIAMTRTGQIAGTPQYMSPEQALGKRVDHRTDLFSLGCVMYSMCTGRAAFQADSAVAVMHQVVHETAPPIRELNDEIPDWLCEIVDVLMAKDPAARLDSASNVEDLLSRHLAHQQEPQGTPRPERVVPTQGQPASYMVPETDKTTQPDYIASDLKTLVIHSLEHKGQIKAIREYRKTTKVSLYRSWKDVAKIARESGVTIKPVSFGQLVSQVGIACVCLTLALLAVLYGRTVGISSHVAGALLFGVSVFCIAIIHAIGKDSDSDSNAVGQLLSKSFKRRVLFPCGVLMGIWILASFAAMSINETIHVGFLIGGTVAITLVAYFRVMLWAKHDGRATTRTDRWQNRCCVFLTFFATFGMAAIVGPAPFGIRALDFVGNRATVQFLYSGELSQVIQQGSRKNTVTFSLQPGLHVVRTTSKDGSFYETDLEVTRGMYRAFRVDGDTVTLSLTYESGLVAGTKYGGEDYNRKAFAKFSDDWTPHRQLTPIVALDISSDGANLVSAHDSDEQHSSVLLVWDINTPKSHTQPKTVIPIPTGVSVTDVALSPDGQAFCWTQGDGKIVFRMTSNARANAVERSASVDEPLYCVAWSPDGQQVIAGGMGKLFVWEPTKADDPTVYSVDDVPGAAGINDLAITADGTQLVTASADGNVFIWKTDAKSAERQHHAWDPTDKKNQSAALSVAFTKIESPRKATEKWVYIGFQNGDVCSFDIDDSDKQTLLQATEAPIHSIAVSTDHRVLAFAGFLSDAFVPYFEGVGVDLGIPLEQISRDTGHHTAALTAVCFSPDGQYIVSGSLDGTITWWSLTKPTPPRKTTKPKEAE